MWTHRPRVEEDSLRYLVVYIPWLQDEPEQVPLELGLPLFAQTIELAGDQVAQHLTFVFGLLPLPRD